MHWTRLLLIIAALAAGASCNRRAGVKEPPITGRPTDAPVAPRVHWQTARRHLYRVDSVTTASVPRRNSNKTIRAEITIGQDLVLAVTNALPDGSCVLQLEIRAVQLEVAKDDVITVSFDSENNGVFADEGGAGQQLQKLVGGRLSFSISAESKVTRVDGARELAARVPRNNEQLRGVAGGVIARSFQPQFYTDLLEMSMLPPAPVRVGERWMTSRQAMTGLWSGMAPMTLSCVFLGWQRHDGTNCVRLDFSGKFNPGILQLANASNRQRLAETESSIGPGEPGTMTGRCWFNPDLSLASEVSYEQFLSSAPPLSRLQLAGAPSNSPTVQVGGPQVMPNTASGRAPSQNIPAELSMISSRQQVVIKLVGVESGPN